jgi:hypothetical protein
MTLNEIKHILPDLNDIQFRLENGQTVPAHFHITEVGQVSKLFIDCGGSIRKEDFIQFQLWSSHDTEHRLKPEKLRDIIALSEQKLNLKDAEIEVEYQAETIGRYGLDFDGGQFILRNKSTACLAEDQCGIPQQKPKITLSELPVKTCTPGSGCC